MALSDTDRRNKTDEYLQRAAECRSLADELYNAASRKEMLDLAEVWASLAEGGASLPQWPASTSRC